MLMRLKLSGRNNYSNYPVTIDRRTNIRNGGFSSEQSIGNRIGYIKKRNRNRQNNVEKSEKSDQERSTVLETLFHETGHVSRERAVRKMRRLDTSNTVDTTKNRRTANQSPTGLSRPGGNAMKNSSSINSIPDSSVNVN